MAPTLSRRARRALGLTAAAAATALAYRAALACRARVSSAETARSDASVDASRGGRRRGAREAGDATMAEILALERELGALDEDTLREGGPDGSHPLVVGACEASGAGTAARAQPFPGGADDPRHRSRASSTRTLDGDAASSSGDCAGDGTNTSGTSRGDEATPNFFASTKFFACLELEESQELFDAAAEEFDVPPNTVVFRQGDDSSSGIYIVVQGALGVYLQEERADDDEAAAGASAAPGSGPSARDGSDGASSSAAPNPSSGGSKRLGPPFLTNILREGESVGDIDVLDNAPRGVSCISMEHGARLVRIRQDALFAFIRKHPRALETYLQQAVARLWRVAHFVLVDFLGIPRGSAGDAVRLDGGEPSDDRDDDEKEEYEKEDARGDVDEAGVSSNPPGARVSSSRSNRRPGRAPPAALLLRHLPDLEACCSRVSVPADGALYAEGDRADDMLLILSGTTRSDAVPWPEGNGARGPPERSPTLIGASAFLTRSARRETLRVAPERDPEGDPRTCVVYSVGAAELDRLHERAPEAYVATLLAASCSLSHLLRRFISLGLNRVWLSAGEAAYVQGEEATSMFVLISGRVRLLRRDRDDDRGGDGSKGGYRARPNEERGRGETIGEAPLLAGGRYPSTAMCLRDSELVRMSRGALTLVCARNPTAASRLLEAMARKLHATLKGTPARPDLVTVALVPARVEDESAVATLAGDLRRALEVFGPTLWLDEPSARDEFRDGTVARLGAKFYRSKLTGWMAQQEENHRFIVLQADARASPWSQVCVSQADKILVVARASARDPAPNASERRLLWRRRRGATAELVLVHAPGEAPERSRRWRDCRPEAVRHHPLRLGCGEDAKRLARHVAGRSVGVILTGGGGHGLAHLGALRALEDVGVPIDCVGGTSQGALMAALYARHASTTHMLPRVKELVRAMSSPRHLLTDLTLPVLSIFSGKGVDRMLRAALGEVEIEDLWLPFFCCSTNLSRGRLSTHVAGSVRRYVRASMTVLGLLPPVWDDGDFLVDGGYLNSIPADVMREHMGAETVIVVDVEDGDYLAFRNLTPHDGGLGGWRLLWERLLWPFASWFTEKTNASWFTEETTSSNTPNDASNADPHRTNATARFGGAPSYGTMLAALMAATSRRQLEQAGREHRINLYLRPPGVSGWVAPLTPERVDALVRRAHRHSCAAVEEWLRAASKENTVRAREEAAAAAAAAAAGAGAGGRVRSAASGFGGGFAWMSSSTSPSPSSISVDDVRGGSRRGVDGTGSGASVATHPLLGSESESGARVGSSSGSVNTRGGGESGTTLAARGGGTMEPVAPGTESGTTLDPPRDSSESPIGSAKVTNATVQTRTDGPIVYGSESTPSPRDESRRSATLPLSATLPSAPPVVPGFPPVGGWDDAVEDEGDEPPLSRRRREHERSTVNPRSKSRDGRHARSRSEHARDEGAEGWTTSALFAPTKDGENDRDGDRDRDGDVDGVPKGVPVCSALVAAREPRERGWDPRLRFESESFGATSASERRKSFSAGDLADLDRASVPA